MFEHAKKKPWLLPKDKTPSFTMDGMVDILESTD